MPVLGWDYGQTNGDDDINKYAISQPLKAGSYISLTLAWDREVVFQNDADMDGAYDDGDTFVSDCCLNDLDLYLMPAGSTSLAQRTTRSNSAVMSLEHIFFQIPMTQQYEIWVHQFGSPFGLAQDYALAWWAVPNMAGTEIGDYDNSGVVDIGDYQVWRANFGSTNAMADGNGNGVVDAADYVVWRKNLAAGSASLASVPEPSCMSLLGFAIVVFGGLFHRRSGQVFKSMPE